MDGVEQAFMPAWVEERPFRAALAKQEILGFSPCLKTSAAEAGQLYCAYRRPEGMLHPVREDCKLIDEH